MKNMKKIKKVAKTLLEIIKGIMLLCWVLFFPVWACMLVYDAAYYLENGEVAVPNVVKVIATIICIVNVIWINRVDEKGGKNNG